MPIKQFTSCERILRKRSSRKKSSRNKKSSCKKSSRNKKSLRNKKSSCKKSSRKTGGDDIDLLNEMLSQPIQNNEENLMHYDELFIAYTNATLRADMAHRRADDELELAKTKDKNLPPNATDVERKRVYFRYRLALSRAKTLQDIANSISVELDKLMDDMEAIENAV
jgi:hypothetical protein